MRTRRAINPDRAAEVYSYNPATGQFHWRIKPRNVKPGAAAGGRGPSGYVMLNIDGVTYAAHRVAWAIMTGSDAPPNIDHKNGNKLDNRWDNLRAATVSQNRANSRRPITNTSGVKGVHFHKRWKLWCARATVCGKEKTIGYFKTIEAAANARRAFFGAQHGEFARHD